MNIAVRIQNNTLNVSVNKFMSVSIDIDQTKELIDSIDNIAKLFGDGIPEDDKPLIDKIALLLQKVYYRCNGTFDLTYDTNTKDIIITSDSSMKVNIIDVAELISSLNQLKTLK